MDEVEGETEEDYARAERALFVSPIRAGRLTVRAGARRPRRGEGECDPEFLMKDTQAKLDIRCFMGRLHACAWIVQRGCGIHATLGVRLEGRSVV